MTTDNHIRDLEVGTVVPVWVLAVVAAVVIGVVTPGDGYLVWLPIALAIAVIATFAIQLSTLTREGFVNRVMASVGGALVILGCATGVLALLAVTSG
ncbi:MAG: hypothetical protein KF692_00860 [Cryobacterium sp.]|nr:hypothetical protein [Micrococcales bacterium]MBX3077773.1 hypothetical protein [Cryobacterium sp.]HMM82336.1 hypothetical protein [Terrimesophilobacter sp.]